MAHSTESQQDFGHLSFRFKIQHITYHLKAPFALITMVQVSASSIAVIIGRQGNIVLKRKQPTKWTYYELYLGLGWSYEVGTCTIVFSVKRAFK